MSINWGTPLKSKCLSFIFGSEWDKGEFRFIEFRKTPLGWDFNVWHLMISYDNWGTVRRS